MNVRPNRRAMDWVMATLVVAMLPQMASMPIHLAAVCLVPVIWRVLAEQRQWKPPGLMIRLTLAGVALALLVGTYGGLLGRRAAVSLLTVMLSLKLVEAWRLRDARVMVTVSVFLSATQFLFDSGIMMVFYIAAVLSCALVALIHLQRCESFAAEQAPPPVGDTFGELRYSGRLLALALPAALLLFLFFPRWGSPLWGVPETALDARSGLSDSMTPGDIQSLFMDDTPAFRVDFEGVKPQQHQLYWRGPVFWSFDGRTWKGSYFSKAATRNRALPREAQWFYSVQMEPTEQHWLFALDYPAIQPPKTLLTMDYQLYSPRAITSLREYQMASDPGFVDTPALSTVLRSEALSLPPASNPRTRELVREWREEYPADGAFIQAVLRHFRQQGFEYTINPPLLGQHTVDEFLFDTRAGFCEHYASSFAVMMRMAGIPSRIVTGYQGGFYSEFGEYLLVRHSDAHAWVEVWLDGMGWTRIDPTAAVSPDRVSLGASEALSARRHFFDYDWLRGARNVFDIAQRKWNDWVIAFSAERQLRLFNPFGFERMGPAGLIMLLSVALLVVGVVLWPLLRRLDAGRNTDAAVRQWQAFLRKLERAGMPTQPGDAPLEVAWQAQQHWPDLGRKIRWITSTYIKCRYQPEPPDYLVIVLKRAVRGFRPTRLRTTMSEATATT